MATKKGGTRKVVAQSRKIAVNSDDPAAPRATIGSGAPVGLSMDDQPDAGESEYSPSERVRALVDKHGGMIEHQPVRVDDGKLKYRWVFYTTTGDAISGNGDDDFEALENLEKRLEAWEAST